jgi:hypothetical protein
VLPIDSSIAELEQVVPSFITSSSTIASCGSLKEQAVISIASCDVLGTISNIEFRVMPFTLGMGKELDL